MEHGKLSPQLQQQVQESDCNLSALLQPRAPPVLHTPLEIIAFADEEGVRCCLAAV